MQIIPPVVKEARVPGGKPSQAKRQAKPSQEARAPFTRLPAVVKRQKPVKHKREQRMNDGSFYIHIEAKPANTDRISMEETENKTKKGVPLLFEQQELPRNLSCSPHHR